MKQILLINVNYEEREVLADDNTTLQEALRDQLGLTGVKEGCQIGECGACTVLIDGRAVSSCLVLAKEVGEGQVTTIEGLARGEELHPIQRSFIQHGAVQCGYCTPGMILSSKALLDRNNSPSSQQVQKALEGNLCRCTGYNKIVEAVLKAGKDLT